MLLEKEPFVLHVASEMYPGRDLFETFSEPIPAGRILHLNSFRVMCDPMRSEEGEPTRIKAELFWYDLVDGEPIYRPISLVYTECKFVEYFSDLNICLDGSKMLGDNFCRLVIRRQIEGLIGPQHNHVAVYGHLH